MPETYSRLHALIDAIENDLRAAGRSPSCPIWALLDRLRLTVLDEQQEAT